MLFELIKNKAVCLINQRSSVDESQAKPCSGELTDSKLGQRGQRDGHQSEKYGKNGGNNELFHYFVSLG